MCTILNNYQLRLVQLVKTLVSILQVQPFESSHLRVVVLPPIFSWNYFSR